MKIYCPVLGQLSRFWKLVFVSDSSKSSLVVNFERQIPRMEWILFFVGFSYSFQVSFEPEHFLTDLNVCPSILGKEGFEFHF